MADNEPSTRIIRLPFAGEVTGRDAPFLKDRYYKNLFIEEYSDRKTVVKRPGLELMDDGGDTCHDGLPGLGLYNWEGILISVFGNTVYSETIGAPVVWTRVADMPAVNLQSYGVTDGDYFYVFGGQTAAGTAVVDTAYRYEKAADAWTTLPVLPHGPRTEMTVDLLPNGHIYVGCGRSAASLGAAVSNLVYWYNPTANAYTAKSNFPIAVYDNRVCHLKNGKLLFTGGANDSGAVLATSYIYNHATDLYSTVAVMNQARANFALLALEDGRAIALGGEDASAALSHVEIYDPTTDAWTVKASMPAARNYHSAAVVGDYVYVWGGGTNISTRPPTATIFAYSIERNAWETLTPTFPETFWGASYGRFDDGTFINAGGTLDASAATERTYITTAASGSTSTVQCTSLGDITEGEAGVSFAEINASGKKLLIKTSKKLYVVDRATLAITTVTDVDYPATTVPGVVALDGYVFVMDEDGVIYNSDLETPTAWNPLNFINAEIEADDGVALAKHLNYVLALGTRSYELFDNAANETGSPLARIEQAYKPIGCIAPWSVAHIGDVTLWIGSQAHDDPVVIALSGFDATVISDPVIQRILKSYGGDLKFSRGVFIPVAGHAFYVIQLGRYWNQFDRTLVYDMKTLHWYEWTTLFESGESAFNVTTATILNGETVVSGMFDGALYNVSAETFKDGTQNIRFEARTDPWDGGVAVRKFVHRARLAGDLQTVSGATIDLTWSDDNYKNFSTARSVSLVTLSALTRIGKTDRRVWRVKSEANAPIRLDGVDMVFSIGEYMA